MFRSNASRLAALLGFAALLSFAQTSRADSYIYQTSSSLLCTACVDQKMELTGFITVDKLGSLSASDVTGWDITINPLGSTPETLTGANSAFHLVGAATMTATADALSIAIPSNAAGFDFSSHDLAWTYGESGPAQVVTYQLNDKLLIGEEVVGFPSTFTAQAEVENTPVPEPASLALMGLGGVSMAVGSLKRRYFQTGSMRV